MRDDAVSPVIGVILMVAITVVLGLGVLLLAQNSTEVDDPVYTGFKEDGDQVMVISMYGPEIAWDDVTVVGCDKPTGTMSGGDSLTNCAGAVTVVWDNKLLFSGDF